MAVARVKASIRIDNIKEMLDLRVMLGARGCADGIAGIASTLSQPATRPVPGAEGGRMATA